MKLNIRDKGAWRAKVFVDGVQVLTCVEADEEAGTATCYTRTPEGMITRNVEVLRGAVEIRFDTPERRAEMEARVRG